MGLLDNLVWVLPRLAIAYRPNRTATTDAPIDALEL